MNVKKKYLVSCLVWISFNWVMCYAHSHNSHDHGIEMRNNRNSTNNQQVNATLLSQNMKRNDCDVSDSYTNSSPLCPCQCTYNCNATDNKECHIISTIQNIVKNILMEINSTLKIIHNLFGSATIMRKLVDPSSHTSYNKIFKEYATAKNIVDVLMELFYNIFHINIGNERMNSINFMSELTNATMYLLSSLPNAKLPNVQNLRDTIGNIHSKINSVLNVSVNNGRSFDDFKAQLINKTISIFERKDESWPTCKVERILAGNMQHELKSIIKNSFNNGNLQNFISQLKEKTINLLNIYKMKSSGMKKLENQIENIRNHINSIMSENLNVPNIFGTRSNWKKPFHGLKVSLEYVKHIPLYIVQIFRSITKGTLMSSNIVKNHWKRPKTHPLFVAQCCSSKIDKLWKISRFGLPTMFNFKTNLCGHKQKLLSPWNNFKQKLLDECRTN